MAVRQMHFSVKVEDKEIDRLLIKCDRSLVTLSSNHPKRSYEQGLQDAILWVTGNDNTKPLAEVALEGLANSAP